jgi:hypothetical protein
VNAVQEATSTSMQARVLAVLEAIGAALPAVGFALGGVVATLGSPRTAYVVAGAGVVLALAAAAAWLRGLEWPARGQVAPEEPATGVAAHGRAPS